MSASPDRLPPSAKSSRDRYLIIHLRSFSATRLLAKPRQFLYGRPSESARPTGRGFSCFSHGPVEGLARGRERFAPLVFLASEECAIKERETKANENAESTSTRDQNPYNRPTHPLTCAVPVPAGAQKANYQLYEKDILIVLCGNHASAWRETNG